VSRWEQRGKDIYMREKRESIEKQIVKAKGGRSWIHDLRMNKALYFLTIPIVLYFIVFSYAPMFGLVIAFQDYKPSRGILGSNFVGLKNFINFFTGPNFLTILRNTFAINALSLLISFPLTIVFALLLNEIRLLKFKKTVQTISYMPYFISMVVICGLVIEFCATNGVITNLLVNIFGIQRVNLLQDPKYFWWINLFSDIWQGLGYGSIIYISAISAVSHEMYEAAAIDGAGRFKRCMNITLPSITPTIVTMLVLKCGLMMSVGGDKILLLYNSSIYSTADVISTHVQRMGIENMQYGYSAAVGLFNSIVGTSLLLISNTLSRKLADTSIV